MNKGKWWFIKRSLLTRLIGNCGFISGRFMPKKVHFLPKFSYIISSQIVVIVYIVVYIHLQHHTKLFFKVRQ